MQSLTKAAWNRVQLLKRFIGLFVIRIELVLFLRTRHSLETELILRGM